MPNAHYTLEAAGQVVLNDWEGPAGTVLGSTIDGTTWYEHTDIEDTASTVPTFLGYLKDKRKKEIDAKTEQILAPDQQAISRALVGVNTASPPAGAQTELDGARAVNDAGEVLKGDIDALATATEVRDWTDPR